MVDIPRVNLHSSNTASDSITLESDIPVMNETVEYIEVAHTYKPSSDEIIAAILWDIMGLVILAAIFLGIVGIIQTYA